MNVLKKGKRETPWKATQLLQLLSVIWD